MAWHIFHWRLETNIDACIQPSHNVKTMVHTKNIYVLYNLTVVPYEKIDKINIIFNSLFTLPCIKFVKRWLIPIQIYIVKNISQIQSNAKFCCIHTIDRNAYISTPMIKTFDVTHIYTTVIQISSSNVNVAIKCINAFKGFSLRFWYTNSMSCLQKKLILSDTMKNFKWHNLLNRYIYLILHIQNNVTLNWSITQNILADSMCFLNFSRKMSLVMPLKSLSTFFIKYVLALYFVPLVL